MIERTPHQPLLDPWHFALLVMSTMAIAAAGYVINDYFDVRTDLINKPDRVTVGRHLSRRQAMLLHFVLNTIGVGLALYLAISIHRPWLVALQIGTAGSLWFYSTYFKKRMISGNILVSGLTALVTVVVLLYQAPSFETRLFGLMTVYALVYAGFAFLVSMMREIVKDMQDMGGDGAEGCCTLPIVAGLRTSKFVVQTLAIMTLLLLALFQYAMLQGPGMAIVLYVLFLVQLPIIFVMAKLRTADRPADFRILSSFIKGIMLTGILSMVVVPLVMHPTRLARSFPIQL
jgi:4-hydroxybenzoate polyprenyltransferase